MRDCDPHGGESQEEPRERDTVKQFPQIGFAVALVYSKIIQMSNRGFVIFWLLSAFGKENNMRDISYDQIVETVRDLCIQSNCQLSRDVQKALKQAAVLEASEVSASL